MIFFFSLFNCLLLPRRHPVEPVVPRLCENGDRGSCAARPLRRSAGSPFWLGEREQRSGRQGGELQAQASGVGDGPHQHSRLPEVRTDCWRRGEKVSSSGLFFKNQMMEESQHNASFSTRTNHIRGF